MSAVLALAAAGLLQVRTDQEDPGTWQYRTHGFQINTGPFLWNGLLVHPTALFGLSLKIGASDVDFESAGIPFRLDYGDKELWMFGGGIEADFGILRLDVEGFVGGWNGRGTMIQQPGDPAETQAEAELDGRVWGVHARLWWPAIVYHGYDVDLTFGPGVGFFWVRETLTDTHVDPESMTIADDATTDEVNEKAFTLGLFLTYEVPIGSVKLVIEAGVEFPVAGDLTGGAIFEVLVGPKFGWSF